MRGSAERLELVTAALQALHAATERSGWVTKAGIDDRFLLVPESALERLEAAVYGEDVPPPTVELADDLEAAGPRPAPARAGGREVR